ncbi:MAG TPA: MoaD/ThiS family protein [Bacillota bacterium]|jgi:molybdopterin converting factor small subunit
MRITVRYYGFLQVLTGLTEEVFDQPSLGPTNSLGELIETIAERRPTLREVCPVGPAIDRNLLVFRNRGRVAGSDLRGVTVADGDVIDLVPPLGGGCAE